MVHSVKSHRITPRLRHVDIQFFYLHHEHGNGLFKTKLLPYIIQFANMGTKLESGPHLMRSSPIAVSHAHARTYQKISMMR